MRMKLTLLVSVLSLIVVGSGFSLAQPSPKAPTSAPSSSDPCGDAFRDCLDKCAEDYFEGQENCYDLHCWRLFWLFPICNDTALRSCLRSVQSQYDACAASCYRHLQACRAPSERNAPK